VLKLGYDASLAKCSPGGQLAMDTIRYSVQQGLARYEFLGSEESWQAAWPIERYPCFTLLVYPYSLRGLLGLLRFSMRFARNKLLRLVSGE
jgi:CelD/BcsL family acetyltransferase involved in cellulose biosynthesis